MKEYYWCRKLLKTGDYYYIYVIKEAAIQIYKNVGYEINIDSDKVPEKIRAREKNRDD